MVFGDESVRYIDIPQPCREVALLIVLCASLNIVLCEIVVVLGQATDYVTCLEWAVFQWCPSKIAGYYCNEHSLK